ncbi:MAG: hypothetical protein WAO78_01390 [Roseovarius sp.]
MITVLSEADIAQIALSDDAIRTAVSAGLQAQAEGQAIAQPTTVFNPVPGRDDLIAVIQGALPKENMALVKTVGGFPGNAAKALATNPGCLILIETETGQITGLMPAATITTQRTAMVTAIGAISLARAGARTLGCVGTRGIGVQAVRYIAGAIPLAKIRLCGRDPEQTKTAAHALSLELAVPVVPTATWDACLAGADIFIDGTALPGDRPLLAPSSIRPGAVIIVFGAYSSLPVNIMEDIDRLVMDRWVADGRGGLGPQTTAGHVTEAKVDALIGDVIAQNTSPRRSDRDRILFCHRGVAACDLMIASALLAAATEAGIGTQIDF